MKLSPVHAVAGAVFALHMTVAERYGVFRDEMYYAACGRHLAFGYVDHPPLVALLARAALALFGESVRGLRVVPALCAAVTIVLAGAIARALGGGRFAQLLAAVCVAAAPELLGTCHAFSMNGPLLALWTAAALLAVLAVVHDRPRAWIGLGAALGTALLAKHSTLFFGAALVVGLAATPQRRVLFTRWPWLGFGVAALLVAPNVAWEQIHGWPTLEFMHNAQARKMVHFGLLAFCRAEAENMLLLTLPVWTGGVAWLLVAERARPARFLGVAFVLVFAIVFAGGGKPYYLAPAFPMVYAAGGVALEALFARVARGAPFVRGAAVAVIAAGGAAIAPMALPILDPPAFVRYAEALGSRPSADEKHDMGPLPQHFADQLGWEAMAAKVARAYAALPPGEQRVAAIYGSNYGEAGAVDFFGPRWGLPPAASGHNTYFLWGPPPGRGDVLITIGVSREDLERTYGQVDEVDQTDEPYAMPYEDHVPIYVCRRPKRALAEVWGTTRHFI
jgi:hypothetical protein